jgi:hypothetical protein
LLNALLEEISGQHAGGGHARIQMSIIEELVLGELAKHKELQPFERGFHWQRGDDATRLWFQPTTVKADDFGLCATAFIETVFSERWPALEDAALARLNRRAVFGSFFSEGGRLGIRASFCIYEKEPAANWVATVLLRAMGEQLALGYGIAQSELIESSLASNRSNLEYPRRWIDAPKPEALTATAERFTRRGLISTHGPHGLVLEVPLAESAPSRLVSATAETALLHVSVDTPHPLAGVGYAATIALPYDPLDRDIPFWCRFLNEQENKTQDFVPRLGAWGMRGVTQELVYSMFWPTNQDNSTLDSTIMNWMVTRTWWLKHLYWAPGIGLAKVKIDG